MKVHLDRGHLHRINIHRVRPAARVAEVARMDGGRCDAVGQVPLVRERNSGWMPSRQMARRLSRLPADGRLATDPAAARRTVRRAARAGVSARPADTPTGRCPDDGTWM